MTHKIFRLVTSLFLAFAMTAITSGPQAVGAAGPWYVSTTGDDNNDCLSPGTPCATINGALGKAAMGDIINVTIGTYTGTGADVVLINNDIVLSGGWNGTFTTQSGTSTIDGQAVRRGINVNGFLTVTIEHFTIQNGFSGIGGGGGIFNNAGTITLSNITISGSSAGDSCCTGGNGGGGIMNFGGTVILNNSTISGNSMLGGFYGSGILNYGSMIINNSTISNNMGHSGIVNGVGTVTLQNSIVANNTTSGVDLDCSGMIGSSGYNIIGSTAGCTFTASIGDLTGVDPLLSPLQDNGGSTFTHALLPGSPAIDAGNPTGCTDQNGNLLTTDQRGVARPQGARCDIGAFELEADGGGSGEVTIDIKPGSQTNPINPKSIGKIPVAILSTADFSAPSEVDKTSLTFGRTGDELSLAFCNKKGEDVNGDGLLDLVCHFKTKLTGFKFGDTEGILKGKTVDGVSIEGRDSVNVVR